MKDSILLEKIKRRLGDLFYVCREEFSLVFRDQGVLIFFILVPLAYPLLYSWIYNNEVVHEVKTVVVDDSHSHLSRKFIRMCDASPDVEIIGYCANMEEAKRMIATQDAWGVYYIPADFAHDINRGTQTSVSVYCDMAMVLHYKALYQTATMVSLELNARLQKQMGGQQTAKDDEILTKPMDVSEVPIFNPAGGYGSFILPAVLMIIIQQTLVLGIGLSAGTTRERNRNKQLYPLERHYRGVMRVVLGKMLCYFMIYSILAIYLTMIVPWIFDFITLAGFTDLLALLFPFILVCIFFGMTVSCMVRYRENVILLVVFTSVPLLFLSGVSWPQNDIGWVWQSLSWLFPSTFGVRAYIRMNSMGATLSDVLVEYRALWCQVLFYFTLACLVYRNQLSRAKEKE